MWQAGGREGVLVIWSLETSLISTDPATETTLSSCLSATVIRFPLPSLLVFLLLEHPELLDLVSCFHARNRAFSHPQRCLCCTLRAGKQQEQNLVGLGSPAVTDNSSVAFGGAWEEHDQLQPGWNPSLGSSLWRAFRMAPRWHHECCTGIPLVETVGKEKIQWPVPDVVSSILHKLTGAVAVCCGGDGNSVCHWWPNQMMVPTADGLISGSCSTLLKRMQKREIC